MLSDRRFRVSVGDKTSISKSLQNGLPQGSVLAPTLFNLYTADIPQTTSQKFIYADDIALLAQGPSFSNIEASLNEDLGHLCSYFKEWHLIPNPDKTTHTCFHLCNAQASQELSLSFSGEKVKYEACPNILVYTLTEHCLTKHTYCIPKVRSPQETTSSENWPGHPGAAMQQPYEHPH